MSRCKHCGARALPLQTRCDYCGTDYHTYPAHTGEKGRDPFAQGGEGVETDQYRARAKNMHWGDEGWKRLLQHPDLEGHLVRGPERPIPVERREGSPRGVMILAVFGFAAFTLVRKGGISGFAGFPAWFFIPAVFAIFRRRSRDHSFPGAPLESAPAQLLEVTEPWGRAQDPRPKALVEFETGQRRRLRLRRDLVGSLQPGDMGVAFVKADVLIDFKPLSI